jgi:hypothetical protein
MRQLSLLLRISGYGALWVGVALVCGVVGALLPILWSPPGSQGYSLGLAVLVCGLGGLIVGTLAASVSVMLVARRSARCAREGSLRSSPSQA